MRKAAIALTLGFLAYKGLQYYVATIEIGLEGDEESMRLTPAKIAAHVLLFVVVIVVMSAVSIWLGIGPVLLSP